MHDAMNPVRVPNALPTDSDDVSDALEIAAALWDAGDGPAAIRCVRRAAEAADAAGDVGRMAALARAAAELEQTRRDSEAPRMTPPPASASSSRLPPPPSSGTSLRTAAAPPPVRPSKPPVPKPHKLPTVRPSTSAPAALTSTSTSTITSTPPPRRVRVSVRTSVRDAALLVVRPLPEGQAPPPGTREAFLVMADDEAEGFASNGRHVG